MPLVSVWAIRPVQSLSACTRVHFIFFTYSILIWIVDDISGIMEEGKSTNCLMIDQGVIYRKI
jgi:hypothetical protein